MKNLLNDLTLKQKLGYSALALGFFAVFAGNPYENAEAKVNTKELAIIVEKKSDHITAEELADWIIKGKSDYRLIDLNAATQYEIYHIPSAENISIIELGKADILRNEKIILYSDGGIHSAQAWMLMKAKGYKGVYTLSGGLEEWKQNILFPALPVNSTAEDSLLFEKKKEISRYFGGVPQTGSSDSEVKQLMPLPKIESPQPGAVGGTAKKKKKEGC
jgi:rhodanese-related sulfurtransferase